MLEQAKKYITIREVRCRYGIGNTTVYDWLKHTDFPKPYRIGPKLVRFKISELEEWERKHNGGGE